MWITKGNEGKLLLLSARKRCEGEVVLRSVARILLVEAWLSVLVCRHLVLGRERDVDIPCVARNINRVVTLRVGRDNRKAVRYGNARDRIAGGILHISVNCWVLDVEAILFYFEWIQACYNTTLIGDGLEFANNARLDTLAIPLVGHLLARRFDKLDGAASQIARRNGDVEWLLGRCRECEAVR